MGLLDASKPAGAIVELFEDGDALRNDGVRLTAARKNPWYVLATVAGEQEGHLLIDDELHQENRRFWNGWMCQSLDHQSRLKIAEAMGLSVAELAPLDYDKQQRLIERFKKAFPSDLDEWLIPSYDQFPKFSFQHFQKPLSMSKFYFGSGATFSDSVFSDSAGFERAYSKGHLLFDGSHFMSWTNFEDGVF